VESSNAMTILVSSKKKSWLEIEYVTGLSFTCLQELDECPFFPLAVVSAELI
jgi:hypothetical protein